MNLIKVIIKYSLVVMILMLGLSSVSSASDASDKNIEEGKQLAFDRKKGNCLACHLIKDGELAGNLGPPLIAMKLRFKDRDVLKQKIWDATQSNKHTVMPPFGRNLILSETEIERVIDYLYSL